MHKPPVTGQIPLVRSVEGSRDFHQVRHRMCSLLPTAVFRMSLQGCHTGSLERCVNVQVYEGLLSF